MARESKADRLTRYKKRIDLTRRWREQEGYDDLWNRLVDLYRGKQFPSAMGSEDRIAVNIAFSTVNVIYPSVSVNYPKITVSATKPEDEDRAVITEACVNYWWRHHDLHEPVRRAVKDYLIIGHGWLKVGYRYIEQQASMNDDEYGQQLDAAIGQADEFAVQNPDMAGDLPTDEEIAANLPDTKTVVVEDAPFVERVSPHDMFVDPEATCMDDIKWICQRIQRPLEEVRKDERYKPGVRRNLKADAHVQVERSDSRWRSGNADSDIDRVTVWECYDLKSNTICVTAEGSDDYLIDPQPMPYAYGHPFVMLRNYDVPENFYPMGDLEAIEALQGELNKTRSQMMNARKKFARKYLYHERAFDAAGRQALASDADNTMVPVSDESRPLSDVVFPMPNEPFPPEAYNYSETIETDIDKISGVNEYARGALPEVRRTATEASIIQDAINARSADKLAAVERTVGQVARRLVQICQQYTTGEQMARVTGIEGQIVWVPYKRSDIQGEFDYAVEAGSTQPLNETFRRQQAIAMMQSLAPLIGTVIDPYAISRHVLQFGFGIKNPEKYMMPQMPPEYMQGGPQGQPPQSGGMPGMQPPSGGPPETQQSQKVPNTGGVPQAQVAQLAGQVGLNAPHLGG